MKSDQLLAEFKAYWRIADELLEKATREQLSTVARILALQSAHYARGPTASSRCRIYSSFSRSRRSAEKELELLRDGT